MVIVINDQWSSALLVQPLHDIRSNSATRVKTPKFERHNCVPNGAQKFPHFGMSSVIKDTEDREYETFTISLWLLWAMVLRFHCENVPTRWAT